VLPPMRSGSPIVQASHDLTHLRGDMHNLTPDHAGYARHHRRSISPPVHGPSRIGRGTARQARCRRLLVMAAVLASVACEQSKRPEDLATVRTAAQLRRLPPDVAGRGLPVEITGTVT
jgi:hypothetical protein